MSAFHFVLYTLVKTKFLQVLPIWEGTSTVMSLDVLRAINKSQGAALSALQLRIRKIAEEADSQVI